MFKYGSFEQEIYGSMKRHLVSNQVETRYGLNKLAKAAEHLDAAAVIFEKAGMHSQAAEITEVLQKLAEELSHKNHDHKKYEQCNCEQTACDHEPGSCKNKAGDKKAMYIGSICDSCAEVMPKEYLLKPRRYRF